MLEQGSVKIFFNNDNKRFGFIIPDGKQPGEDDVFFHYNGFRKFEVGEQGQPVFSNTGYDHPAAFPKKGDKVWFVRCVDHRMRTVAEPWGYNHDYQRVMKEVVEAPNYGEEFLYVMLDESQVPARVFSRLGNVESLLIPMRRIEAKYGQLFSNDWKTKLSAEDLAQYEAAEAKLEKYQAMVAEKTGMWPRNIIRVIPNPGKEKMLGRMFRQYSIGDGIDRASILIVEIPKQYEYAGVMEKELLQSDRSLSGVEIRKLTESGKSAFGHSSYWHTWHRTMGFIPDENGELVPVHVALTPVPNSYGQSTWEENIAPIAIYIGWLGGNARKNEGPFAIFPQDVKDDMVERLGEELANQLLTEDFTKLFTYEQFREAQRRHIGGGWLPLNEVLAVSV